ncbi:DNA polymerase epsilon catalytic subunit A [Acorus calamus]|uniref:DNA polymerase epsilon catalytic subunit n=1 Tax=Acorus calamus TaxID=4465 RepID=A0AAV9C3G0_ACOCL|nr:DNA polymerase epsilon catalytic subunit A [Acorus calamus]
MGTSENTLGTLKVQQPVLTYPGAYRRITIELKAHHLAVNALLKSNLVDEMDGGALLGFDHDIPMSKLHDPALHRILHKVMQKVFALLLVKIRKPGGTVIFANFSKIIKDTGKFDLVAAQAYCDCLLKTLQTR